MGSSTSGQPGPDKHIFVLTCTRTGDAHQHPEKFRVAAADAEHAVAIAKKQGLIVIEFRRETPSPPSPPDDTYALKPDAPARRPMPARSAAQIFQTRPPTQVATQNPRVRWPLVVGGVVLGILLLVAGAAALALLRHARPPARPANLGTGAPGVANVSDDWYAPLFASASPSCVTIRTRFGNGSGFAVKPYLICTNAHVVRGDSRRTLVVVQPESGLTANVVGVIHFDAFRDIALVAVDKPFPVLEVALHSPPPVGDALMAIGSPGLDQGTTLENSVSRLLAAKPVAIGHTTMLQLNGSVNPGNSGGPLLHRTGVVAGMITAKAKDKDGIAFAVLASDIREAIEGADRLSPDLRVATDQRHSAAALVYRQMYARAYEFQLLQEWDKIVDRIPSNSERVGNALSAARAELDRQQWVQDLRERVRDDNIAADLAQLEKDGLGADVVQAVKGFDAAVQDMATFAKYPRGNPAQLREQIKRHKDSLTDAAAHVCGLLNMPELDWEEAMK